MLIPDVNVLVQAHRGDAARHADYASWWENLINGGELFNVPAPVEHGFLRIVTNRRSYPDATPMGIALAFCRDFRESPVFADLPPMAALQDSFERLLRLPGVSGNLIPDAYLAALAIEADAEFITADRGFARFPGLRWRHPLDG